MPVYVVTDHPRSRGVYYADTPQIETMGGSSPLARGLPTIPRAVVGRTGIIPARAGFTPCLNGQDVPKPDHPRSRGVYASREAASTSGAGSSPLARGLRDPVRIDFGNVRIIPARAGFTKRVWDCWITRSDHPRSRGVYKTHAAQHTNSLGSSPLARGLRGITEIELRVRGIIPARAGFTAKSKRWGSPTKDHPRSRGVYGYRQGDLHGGGGSSPLARGLRTMKFAVRIAVGIIPARAGFTWGRSRPAPRRQDHPRSRGVYNRRGEAGAGDNGSSPLARGLPRHETAHDDVAGIIPARAGFTAP